MLKILITDDSWVARMALKKVLVPAYEVEEAGDGNTALAKIDSWKPDLLILDLLMPEPDGFAVLATLKAKGMPVPVLVMSADIQETTREKIRELGAVDLINKPPRPEVVLALLKKLFESRGLTP